MDAFAVAFVQVTRQELLDGGLEPNERAVTLVLCDDDVEVESLYTLNFVDAKAVPVSGSSMELDPDEVRTMNMNNQRDTKHSHQVL